MSNRSLTPAWTKRSQDTWGAQGDSGGKNAGTRKSAAVLSITKRADGAGPGGGCLRGMKQQCHWKEGHGSPPPTHPSWPTPGGPPLGTRPQHMVYEPGLEATLRGRENRHAVLGSDGPGMRS